MRPVKLSVVCLLVAAVALGAAPAAKKPASAKVPQVDIPYKQYTLKNGLSLIVHEDHKAPIVAVNIWYHTGSKNEKPGKTGFAHLFEHLMFKGSAHVGPEEHKNFIASIGGRYNATTDFDRTLYFQSFPSNYLERVLWMEADRMSSLNVSDENFKSERDVVKEERRLRVDNPPFGRLFEVVLDKTFTTHPYKIETIGSIADLDAATVQDVRDFHSLYYVPNNATLVVAGDFDPAQTRGWIEKHFEGADPDGRAPRGRLSPERPPAGGGDHLSHPPGREPGQLRPPGGEQHPLGRRELAALQADGLREADGGRRGR